MRCGLLALLFVLLAVGGCAGSGDGQDAGPVSDVAETRLDAAPEIVTTVQPEAAARAFRLYYRERVERAVVAYNRFLLFGDVGFGATVGKAGVARTGDEFEVVAGPNDNNAIGVSVWNTWMAYRVFGSRTLALSLVRMFDGLVFLEAVSGHPGLTARHAVPGWTGVIDGAAGLVTRTRDGALVEAPGAPGAALEGELLATFWAGVRFTYREDPRDYLLSYMPAQEVGPYAATYSFEELPRYLRVSDCCTSLMRTPAPYAWEGSFWSNHNSRDNFPDLATGYLAARVAAMTQGVDPEVKAAAERAAAAGRRVGDSIRDHGWRLMTVDEHNPYDTLVVAGAVRPDGETEAEDLGSLSDCQMAYLARALSSSELALPLPELPLPASIEKLISGVLGGACPVPEGDPMCTRLEQAYCGADWGTLGSLELGGKPWLDRIQAIEDQSPGMAQTLIGGFQDDYYEKNIAMLALVGYAQLRGDDALLAGTRLALGNMTRLLRRYADIIYTTIAPERRIERHYDAALFDAQAGIAADLAELDGFARAEAQIAHLEGLLDLPDTAPAPLLTDDELQARVAAQLATRSDSVKARYAAAYGDQAPIRRAGEGYEARSANAEGVSDWHAVERPRHRVVGGLRLLEALPLCETAPEILDCTWARLGCRRPDLDASGTVDAADATAFMAARELYADAACADGNAWCSGADLDRSGAIDDLDQAFLAAAEGCWYTR